MASQGIACSSPNLRSDLGRVVPSDVKFARNRRTNTQPLAIQAVQAIARSARNEGIGVKVSKTLIHILSVEPHPVFQEGLDTIIRSQNDMLLVGQAANAVEAVVEFRRYRPDIILMDLLFPGCDGMNALISIRGEFPEARIIILSDSNCDAEIQRALRAGAVGFIAKSVAKDELLSVIKSVHAGRRHIPAAVAACLAEHLADEDLTERELDVLRYIRDGFRNKQIADRLGIEKTTVNFHIKNLVDKLGANSRTHAVTIAIRRGLIQI